MKAAKPGFLAKHGRDTLRVAKTAKESYASTARRYFRARARLDSTREGIIGDEQISDD